MEGNPFRLMAEAHRLRHEALGWCCGGALDEAGAQWLMTAEAWDFFRAEVERDAMRPMSIGTRRLMGLPVRLTYDDEPDTPMIQLVMEPKVAPRFRR